MISVVKSIIRTSLCSRNKQKIAVSLGKRVCLMTLENISQYHEIIIVFPFKCAWVQFSYVGKSTVGITIALSKKMLKAVITHK